MKKRAFSLLSAAVLVGLGLIGSALPAAADPDPGELIEVGTDMSSAAVSVAADNAAAISADATATPPDNVSCTVGGFGGANVTAIEVPNQVFVNGKDLGIGDGACSDLDTLAPDSFTAYMRITVQYRLPGQTVWNNGASDRCTKPAVQGQAVIEECALLVQYPKEDPVQTYVRRLWFQIGILRPGNLEEMRSERFFGPLVPHCGAIAQARCRPTGS